MNLDNLTISLHAFNRFCQRTKTKKLKASSDEILELIKKGRRIDIHEASIRFCASYISHLPSTLYIAFYVPNCKSHFLAIIRQNIVLTIYQQSKIKLYVKKRHF